MTDRRGHRDRVHPPGAAELDVRPYDFERPELLSEQQHERLASAFESFGRSLGLQLTAKTRTVIDVEYGGFVISPAGALRDPDDSAAYVGVERVTGRVNGREGSFVYLHTATAAGGAQSASWPVVDGSGTGELAAGIAHAERRQPQPGGEVPARRAVREQRDGRE